MSRWARFFLYLCVGTLTCLLCVRQGVLQGGSKSKASGEDQLQPALAKAWEAEQHRRKDAVQRACRDWSPKAREYLPQKRKDMIFFLVDDTHKALYCYVPKVSCTNWKRIWMILTGLSTEKDPLAINETVPHLLHHKMMLVDQLYNDSVVLDKLTSYTKLLVVRDPYERLLSAYRDKLEHGNNHTYWKKHVNQILNYNKKRRLSTNTEITYSAFVNYVSRRGKASHDEHWRPYHQLCYPCAIKYDVIAKYETLTEDSDRFLRLIGAPSDLRFPPYVSSKTASFLPQYMANLSQTQRYNLYQVYRRDFETFEYQPFWSSG